jgi:hypothetical protein
MLKITWKLPKIKKDSKLSKYFTFKNVKKSTSNYDVNELTSIQALIDIINNARNKAESANTANNT